MSVGVWVVGGPGDREDLRYSLRSVAKNAPMITSAWIAGDVPDWFTGKSIKTTPKPGKFENQRASLTAFANHPHAPKTFYLFNDDMFVIEPTKTLPPVRAHGETGLAFAADHRAESSNLGRCVVDCWQCAVGETAAWAAGKLGRDVELHEAHAPLLFDTARLREVLGEYPAGRPFAVGEVYEIAGAGPVGRHAGNAKTKQNKPEAFAHKLSLDMPYLSTDSTTWAGLAGDYIRGLFPEPCRWEE